jgi:hypothetical protein
LFIFVAVTASLHCAISLLFRCPVETGSFVE